MRPQGFLLPPLPAEARLLEKVGTGEWCWISDERPGERGQTPDNTVRASFIRFLALGGDQDTFVHEHGVQLAGAWVEGVLDFEGCEIPRTLVLFRCRFEAAPVFLHAKAKTIVLSGSVLPGFKADGLHVTGGLFLRDGFEAEGEVRLPGARIGGDLSCNGGKFRSTEGENEKDENKSRVALHADGLDVIGGVFFGDGFEADGAVRLPGARIGGDLSCNGGKFRNEKGMALIADRLDVTGSVFLADGFEAEGEVGLVGARIGGELSCIGGKFRNGNGVAIQGQKMQVEGAFQFRNVETDEGHIDLNTAHVEDLVDDAASWAKAKSLILDGFTYDRLAGTAPTDYASRKGWLLKQLPSDLAEEFKPQPFEQLAKVLREMGHVEDARRIAILKQDYQRRASWLQALRRFAAAKDQIDLKAPWKERLRIWAKANAGLVGAVVRRSLGWAFKWTSGYGYRPIWALGWMALWWVIGVGVFSTAYSSGAMIPGETRMLVNATWLECAGIEDGQKERKSVEVLKTLDCFLQKPPGRDYPRFNAFVYSLDTFVPILDLHQESAWMPQPMRAEEGSWAGWARGYLWVHIIFGWIFTTLAVLGFTGLVKKDP